MKSKRVGKIYDGRWECVEIINSKTSNRKFRLKNIYNDNEIIVNKNTMSLFDKGMSVCTYFGKVKYRK